MYDLWPLLCSSERFSTRWFYSGGGNAAGASSWKVHNLNGKTHDHRTGATLLWRSRWFTRAQFKCFHRTMFVVPCICTQCVFHGNKSNFNAGIYVIMTILNTNLGLSQISPQRMHQFDCVIFMINSSKSHSSKSLIYPFIPLIIYHLFIFIYKISICFNLLLFALLY